MCSRRFRTTKVYCLNFYCIRLLCKNFRRHHLLISFRSCWGFAAGSLFAICASAAMALGEKTTEHSEVTSTGSYNIVVACDSSPQSRAALKHAIRLCRCIGPTIEYRLIVLLALHTTTPRHFPTCKYKKLYYRLWCWLRLTESTNECLVATGIIWAPHIISRFTKSLKSSTRTFLNISERLL